MALVVTSANSTSFSYSSSVYEWPTLTERYVGSRNNKRHETALSVDDVMHVSTHESLTHAEHAADILSDKGTAVPDVTDQDPLPSCDLAKDAMAHKAKGITGGSGETNNSNEKNDAIKLTSGSDYPSVRSLVDARPKICKNPKACCNSHEIVDKTFKDAEKLSTPTVEDGDVVHEDDFGGKMSKKKKKHRKVREKSNKKWKTFQFDDLGFHISLLPRYPSQPICSDETEDNSDVPCSESELCEPQPATDEANNTAQDEKDTATVNENTVRDTDDDVAFFRELGVNVLDHDDNDDFDEFMDWDGVFFPWENHASLPPNKEELNRHASKGQSRTGKKFTPTSKAGRASSSSAGPKIPTKNQNSSSVKITSAQCDVAESLPWYLSPSPSPSAKIKKCDRYKLFELETCSSKKMYIRRDRHRRVEKAHKAVKSKNCVSIFNNRGRKNLYMHHRLVKMHSLCLDFRQSARTGPVPRMPKKNLDLVVARSIVQADRSRRGGTGASDRPAPKQNLKHALHETNAPSHLELDLASFLISLQHRELTPEDYDMLLRLDDTVKPKTVPKHVLDTLKTEKVGPDGAGLAADGAEILCTICMEPYTAGQERKFLPCNHDFHTACIDMWLKNSSMNCPLDGLPLEPL